MHIWPVPPCVWSVPGAGVAGVALVPSGVPALAVCATTPAKPASRDALLQKSPPASCFVILISSDFMALSSLSVNFNSSVHKEILSAITSKFRTNTSISRKLLPRRADSIFKSKAGSLTH